MNAPTITNNRQHRALIALVQYGAVSSKDMRQIAGALNAPELMATLKRNGWQWTCERVQMVDRDGKKCRPGIYRLTPEHRAIAAKILNSHPEAAN